MTSAWTIFRRSAQTFAPGNLLPYGVVDAVWIGTLGAHLLRRSVSRDRIAAEQPQLVKVAERHGARKLLGAFERMAEANVFYMNLPYGEAGAYIWI